MAATTRSDKKSLTEFVEARGKKRNPLHDLPAVVQNEIVLGRQVGIGVTMIARWLVNEHGITVTVGQVRAFLMTKGL